MTDTPKEPAVGVTGIINTVPSMCLLIALAGYCVIALVVDVEIGLAVFIRSRLGSCSTGPTAGLNDRIPPHSPDTPEL